MSEKHWAQGCEHCEFGIRRKPSDAGMPDSLHIVRPLQAVRGHIEFCQCRAGRMYRKNCLELSSIRLAFTIHQDVMDWIDGVLPSTLSGR